MVSVSLFAVARIGFASHPTPEQSERIRSLVETAREHRESGETLKAFEALHDAIAIHPAPWLFYSVGRMHEDAGRLDVALAWYSQCLGPDADAETRKRAEARTTMLGNAGLRVNIVEFQLSPPDAELLVDGVVWKERLGRVLSLALGEHTITVRHPDFETAAIPFEVKGPLPQRFELALLPKTSEPPPAPLPPPPPPSDGAGAWPWVTVGAGIASAAVGTWLILDGTADWDAVRDARSDLSLTREEADALVANGETKRTAGFVAAGVGGALVLTGLLWYALEDGPDDTTAFTVVPAPGGIELGVGGTF